MIAPFDESEGIPSAALEQAHSNIQKDALRRYLCSKYTMPPTDVRLKAYTPEEAMLEWLEDALDSGAFVPGMGGKPARKIHYKGTEIYVTGSPMFDALERSWADSVVDDATKIVQEPLSEYMPSGEDILTALQNRSPER